MPVKQCWDVLHPLFVTRLWGMCAASINLCTRSQDHSSASAQLAWLSGTAGADVLCDQRGVTIAAWSLVDIINLCLCNDACNLWDVSMGCVSAWQ